MGTFVYVFLWGKPAAVMSAELARHRDVSVRYWEVGVAADMRI